MTCKCGTENHAGAIWCYWCNAQLREIEDWNPSPDEWFAEVGEYLANRVAFVRGALWEVARLAAFQGGGLAEPVGLIEAARHRLTGAFRLTISAGNPAA